MSRKRKNEDNNESNNKKKHNSIDWNEMISASSIRNYMLDDPLIDWLKYYSIDNINKKPKHNNHSNNINHSNSDFIINL